jgi:putative endonuclease
MYYAYVLKNLNGFLYKGSTGLMDERIDQHNGNIKYPAYTKTRGPWKLVYFEIFETRAEAMRREKFFKSGVGRDFLKTVIK